MIDNSEKFNGGKTGLVEQEILRQIDLGNFRRNSLLPSERELAKQLGVSYMTVRRAIGKLVDDSFLTRVQGKGTYVRGDVPLHRMQQTLGIVVPAWETPEHADLMMILTAIAGENGVLPKFHLCRSWEDRTVVDAYESCDYLLLVPPAPLADLPEEMLVRFRAGTTPVVVLGLDATPYGLDSVTGDACTEAGIRELRRLGHCRIGLMTQVEERGGKLLRQTETFYRNWRLRMLERFSAKEVDRMEIRIPVKAYELPHQAFYDYLYVNGKDLPFAALMLPLAVAWGVISAAADSGRAEGRENAHLRVRLNGSWYETALDGIQTDENGMAWVPVEVPASQLRSSDENQVLISSDAEAASAYSGSSVDLYATGTPGADSYCNVNNYYDDWTRKTDGEWNLRLEGSVDGGTWVSLTGSAPAYCDSTYQLGLRSDGSRSHAAKNLFLGDVSGYQYVRLLVQVHIGDHLSKRAEHTTVLPEPGVAQRSGNGKTPLLWVRVNGQWQSLDLTEYLGTNGQWVTCPIDISRLNAGQENYFGLTTNVVSYGNFTDSSVDFYATCTDDGLNSFLTNDPYSDNDFSRYEDRNINLVLELFDGSRWVSVPAGEAYAYDEHTVLGLFGDNNTWYNAARNLMLGDLSGYQSARIRVQMHVGSSLTVQDMANVKEARGPVSHSSEIPEEKPAVREVKDNEDVKLRIRVNGQWFETSLQPFKGQKAVWVPVEIDLGSLRAGEENYFHVSSTAVSYGSHTANSVDLFYSNANADLNSFLTADEYCDNGWTRSESYNFNLRLELFDGTKWVTAAPNEETYYDGSVPVGYLGDENNWNNAARNVIIGSLDGYTAARVVVQLHVGSAIAGLDDPVDGGVDTFDRSADVGKPEHAAVKTALIQPEEPAESRSWVWLAVTGGIAVVLIAVGILLLAAKRKQRVK